MCRSENINMDVAFRLRAVPFLPIGSFFLGGGFLTFWATLAYSVGCSCASGIRGGRGKLLVQVVPGTEGVGTTRFLRGSLIHHFR